MRGIVEPLPPGSGGGAGGGESLSGTNQGMSGRTGRSTRRTRRTQVGTARTGKTGRTGRTGRTSHRSGRSRAASVAGGVRDPLPWQRGEPMRGALFDAATTAYAKALSLARQKQETLLLVQARGTRH